MSYGSSTSCWKKPNFMALFYGWGSTVSRLEPLRGHSLLFTTKSLWTWVRFHLILTRRDIYINPNLNPLTKFTSSRRSTEFKDTLPWNISQMITKTIPISTTIVISYAMNQGILLWLYWQVNGNWDNNMITISQRRESHCKTNTCVRKKKQIQKSKTVGVAVRDSSRTVNHLSKMIWDRKIITEFSRSISSTRIG